MNGSLHASPRRPGAWQGLTLLMLLALQAAPVAAQQAESRGHSASSEPLASRRAQAEAQHAAGRSYSPGPFQRLEISGAADVRLLQGDRDEVFIAGDEETQKSVTVQLRGNRLEIQPSGNWKFWRSKRLQMEVTVRQLENLELSGNGEVHAPATFRAQRLSLSISGSGLVRFDDLQAQRLHFAVAGSGEGQLRGQVDSLSLAISGKGKLQAEQLRSERAAVAISGVGQAQLWVTRSLSVAVMGVGTVDYWGSPQVSRDASGLAKINARGETPPGALSPAGDGARQERQ